MNKFIEALPFVLLLALVPFFYYNSPNIAQSIIIVAVSALCGYRYYLLNQEKPDYAKIFKNEIIAVEREIVKLNQNYGKLTIHDINKKKEESKFHF
jgi:hypothetical protein